MTPRIESFLALMKRFDAWRLAMLLHHINDNKASISRMCSGAERDELMPPESLRLFIDGIVHMALHASTVNKLQSTHDRVWANGPFSMKMKMGMTYQEAEQELTVLRQCIEADLERLLFISVEPKRADLYATMLEVWADAATYVPESKQDIEDAHISYMTELHTATVFHAMRIAEYGLRVLAKNLRVSFDLKHKGHIVPIEYADWQKVITAIRNKLTVLSTKKVGPKRQALLEKYSDAADHCVFMKDIWRNTASHARKPYNAAEAKAALDRVNAFMNFVAKEFVKKNEVNPGTA